SRKEKTLPVLRRTLHDILILLHPFTPFVTEEIWWKLPGTEGSIMKASSPLDAPDAEVAAIDEGAEADMGLVMEVISGIRNIRGEMNIPPSKALNASFRSPSASVRKTVESHKEMIINLARLNTITVAAPGEKPRASATAIVGDAAVFVSLEGIIDFNKEAERLEKEIGKLAKEIKPLSNKLRNDDFLGKAPEQVVNKVKEKHGALLEKQQRLQSTLDKVKELEI
ncbi:MAG: class I tRNA ligase family protein, partial [Desulfobacterales bacterium]|nr:class I tRNA ligase family protein [Desulfobacterales bacterium]